MSFLEQLFKGKVVSFLLVPNRNVMISHEINIVAMNPITLFALTVIGFALIIGGFYLLFDIVGMKIEQQNDAKRGEKKLEGHVSDQSS